jgi:branched-chain amino acid transport system permease protein
VSYFFSLLVSGISIGFVYGLIALGFVIVFKATKVVNFTHAAVALFGAYVVARTQETLGFWLALLAGVTAAVVLNVLIDVVVLGNARRPDPGTLSIITIGLAIVIGAELRRHIGFRVFGLGDPWGADVIRIGDSFIPQTRVAAAAVAIVVLVLFAVAFRFSNWGVAMRAASEDPEAAALMGVRLRRVSISAWAVAGALATIGGVFFLTFPGGGVTSLAELAILGAFPAAIIGGLDSTGGAVVGGLLVGVTVTLAAGYQNDILFLGRGVQEAAPFILMLIVLLVRPTGLFGTTEIHRV